jgi:hypothetical protein
MFLLYLSRPIRHWRQYRKLKPRVCIKQNHNAIGSGGSVLATALTIESLFTAYKSAIPVENSMERLLVCRIWGSHNGGYEEFYLPGYNAVQSAENQVSEEHFI